MRPPPPSSYSSKPLRRILKNIYNGLYGYFGPQHWWPGDTRLEIIVGAILTQNTAWSNVEKAIRNLKGRKFLSSVLDLQKLDRAALAKLIKPAGYYNIKSTRIRNFLDYAAVEYRGSLRKMSFKGTQALRTELLQVNGIGPETCDSILLYAFKRPVFVVDAYTKRIFSRHRIFKHDLSYDDVQNIFTANLPLDHNIYNEYHALIVRLAKEHCRTAPRCKGCPLERMKCGSNYLANG